MSIKTVVIPVAGMGTRFLPATKAVSKEMLPLLDKPLLHYAIEEAKSAGITSFIFVTNLNNKFPSLYLSKNKILESHLREKNKLKTLKMIRDITLKEKNIRLVYQKKPLGLGDAIHRTKKYVGKDDFAVLLPDDLILGRNCLKELISVYNKKNSNVIGVMSVDKKEVNKYGIVKGSIANGRTSKINELVEKPKIKDAPSRLAVVGRYILKNNIFKYLRKISKGAENEIQLTDAISLSAINENVFSYEFSGTRYDCGSKLGFIKAQLACAMLDNSIRKSFKKELEKILRRNY
ncbi:MAG: UTP--glucose-1-phosphate uridylyltransferase [Alphaproteobacteria bacterium MarineAlpha9_Bin4]|nr:UTP--glucose-1-phosphate uridylyltransferase [Pelagibacterales bacterium]PPR26676.1 MAG: UTP--glucose-1-phosphate uridylyltransferase [Alphaproteobacteria bacterium MarineAlpha9_Bin4]|tara:strand:- start:405 stop:1277 length:873 start_codon:yes stop_codon:yes gene_type:complete